MNKAVFLDRDGTMAEDVNYCSRPEDFELFPSTAQAIKLFSDMGFKVIVVTNQSGIARGYFTQDTLTEIHSKMTRELAKEGVRLDAIYYCPHHPDDNCECRKPKPKLILQAAKDFDLDLARSYMVGDFQSDIALGKAAGCKTMLIAKEKSEVHKDWADQPDAIVCDLLEVVKIVQRWEG
ncbi:MAG: D-glycero-beta-D-manno-heptose 1,7-bisphosphate 7-phosphatase [Chloroflexi bacterium]|jgi:histidinol-phosphate phosphatase family protein|nr:D-glycero-beta-D-manno-heptose 1,7-bisphosphate 7-phosphatase [Chloroflexota bacterium]